MKVVSTMQRKLPSSSLILAGLIVDGISADAAMLTISVHAVSTRRAAPVVRQPVVARSQPLHPPCVRSLAQVAAFAFVLLPAASGAVHHLGLALGERPGASFA